MVSVAGSEASLRVMHVITSAAQGGAQRLLSDIIARRPEGSEHSVLSLTEGDPFFDFGPNFSSLGLRRGEMSLSGLCRLRAAVIAFKPDVLHSWLYHAMLAASFAVPIGTEQVWGIHNTDLPRNTAKPLTRLIARLCGLLSYLVPNQIVYCSATAAFLHGRGLGYSSSRTHVIENGCNFSTFAFDSTSRARLRAEWGLDEGDLAVGSIGRFSPEKGHDVVAAALRHPSLKKAIWVVAGDGCAAENQDFSLLRLGLRSLALGPRRDVAAVLSALDVLVIGSSSGEALPVVGLEAVANGLPVVASRVGDVELLVATSAQLAHPSDVNDLSRAISFGLSLRRGIPELDALRERLLARCQIDLTAAAYHRLYADMAFPKQDHQTKLAVGSRSRCREP